MTDARYQSRAVRLMRRRRRIVLLAALVAALLLLVGIFLGQRAAYSGMGIEPAHYRQMEVELPQLRAEKDQLEQTLVVQQTRTEVDRNALEMLRSELAGQKEHIADLEEALRFFRGLMAPEQVERQGLGVRPIELLAQEQAGSFAYRLVVQQEARKHQTLTGELAVMVVGTQAGEPVSLPLAELDNSLESNTLALRFRYFQSIEGVMQLPSGFEPERVEVQASSNKPRKQQLRESFDWRLKERFTHVGQ